MHLFYPYRHKKTQFWSPLLLGLIAILSASVEYQSQNSTVTRSSSNCFTQYHLLTDIDVLDTYQAIAQTLPNQSCINTYPVRLIPHFTINLDISAINYYLPRVRAGPTPIDIQRTLS